MVECHPLNKHPSGYRTPYLAGESKNDGERVQRRGGTTSGITSPIVLCCAVLCGDVLCCTVQYRSVLTVCAVLHLPEVLGVGHPYEGPERGG